MPTAETNPAAGGLVDINYVAESEFGSTPASATFKGYPNRRTTLNVGKDTFRSEVRSASRQRKHSKHGYKNIGGDIMSELASQWHDDFLEALLGGTWASVTNSTVLASGSIQPGGSKLQSASAAFITEGFKVGDIFTLAVGANDANSGIRHQIASITETEIEVYGSTLVATTIASINVRGVGKKVAVGNSVRSFSIERFFSNLGLYQLFKGMRVNSGHFTVQPNGIIGLDFNFMGQDADALTSTKAGSAYTSAPTSEPMATIFGSLYEGTTKTELALITGFDLTLTNNMTGDKVLFRNTTPAINFGRFHDVSGTLTLLFNGPTQYNKFLNETETTFDIVVYDGSNQNTAGFIRLHMERVKFNTGDLDDSAETSIPMTVGFESLEPTGTSGRETRAIVIQRSN